MNALTILTVVTLLAPLAAQGERLQRAILIEEQERNSKQAARLYQEIAKAEATTAADRTVAWYRLGRVLRRLGKEAEARQALQEAAKGKGPTAEAAKKLLGDDGQETDKEKRMRASARSIIKIQPSGMRDKLLWIGEAAVPEICDAYDRAWRSGNSSYAELLWKIGGKRAEAFLRGVLADGEADYKRAIVQAVQGDYHPGLLDVALGFMDDESVKTSNTLNLAAKLAYRAPIARLARLTRSNRTKVAAGVWSILTRRLSSLKDSGGRFDTRKQAAELAVIEPAIRSCLAGSDAVVASAASEFVRYWGMLTRSGLQLLLDRLPDWPRMVMLQRQATKYTVDAAILLAVGRKMGPADAQDRRAQWLASIANSFAHAWGAGSLEHVLELVKLGYFQKKSEGLNLASWLGRSSAVTDQSASRIVFALADTKHLYDVISILAPSDLSDSTWPILKRCWEKFGNAGRRDNLFYCMGKTGAEEAMTFLVDGLKSPNLFRACSKGLRVFSKKKDTPAVREALRTAVRTGLAFSPPLDVWNEFQRLMELGDTDAIKLAAGLGERAVKNVPRGRTPNAAMRIRSFLSESWNRHEEKYNTSHGFDEKGLAAAWAYLLDLDPSYWIIEIIHRSSSTSDVRRSIVEMLLPRLDDFVSTCVKNGSVPDVHRLGVLLRTLRLPGRWSKSTPELNKRIQALVTRCLNSDAPELQRQLLQQILYRKPLPDQRTAVLRLLRSKVPTVATAAFAVMKQQVTLSEGEFTDLLKTGGSFVRENLLGSYLAGWKGSVALASVVPALSDEKSNVRIVVCKYLGRRAEVEAVAPLLNVLRDPVEKVREAAREALQSIRFYHEQQAHWDRMFKGPRADANSAAERLVKQAGSGEQKDVRLLAIRSLGLLGKVEVVPFLIDFSKEEDADIAAAAKQAIQTIHKKAASGK